MARNKNLSQDYVEVDENNRINSQFILPSKKKEIKKNRLKKLSPYIKTLKYSLYLSLFIIIYLFYQPILIHLTSILNSNPTIYFYILFIKTQIANNTLIGLFFAGTLGSIFFLALPSEALFIYFLDSTSYNFILIIIIMILGNLTGLFFNWSFGRLMGERVLKFIFKEKKFFSYQEKIREYGGILLFLGNIFPGPIEILSVFYGGFKFQLKYYLFLSFMGRLIKYIILFVAYYFYWAQITYYWIYIKSMIGF